MKLLLALLMLIFLDACVIREGRGRADVGIGISIHGEPGHEHGRDERK
jgi:hypothetical protein